MVGRPAAAIVLGQVPSAVLSAHLRSARLYDSPKLVRLWADHPVQIVI